MSLLSVTSSGQRNSFSPLHFFVIVWSWLRSLAVHKQEETGFRSYPVCELWFTAKHGGYKISPTVRTRKRESEGTDSTPLSRKKDLGYRRGKESEPYLEQLCVRRLPVKCDNSGYTNTDVIVCATRARLCAILSQIREGKGTVKLHICELWPRTFIVGVSHTHEPRISLLKWVIL